MKEIRNLIAGIGIIHIFHIYREGNRRANKLADYACSMEGDFCFFEQQPVMLSQLLLSDSMEIVFPRVMAA